MFAQMMFHGIHTRQKTESQKLEPSITITQPLKRRIILMNTNVDIEPK